jgi:predicted Zn-dependent protease
MTVIPEEDLSNCTALLIDGNHASRSIVMAQLRELGIRQITQVSRTADGRNCLESQKFDFVLCEMHFADETASGQDLLDDLRRNQLLPFSTVFIMITGEATYAKVAEAAESALDGYLLKPHKASHLAERLKVARIRKLSLQEIFDAIDAQEFEQAANLCLDRFDSRGLFWLYAARVGAELLLLLGRYDDAQMLYQAVVAAKTLPWAKLGIARAQLEAGQLAMATTTVEKLIGDDPSFVDAYDVLGRAQFELSQFDKCLSTYKMAAMLTPQSISRLQSAAMMTFYAGNHAEAERLLARTTRMGLESKMFDCQTLVLLAYTRLELNDRKGLQVCLDDMSRLVDRNPHNGRMRRLANFVTIANLLIQLKIPEVSRATAALAELVLDSEFDFESAGNMLALLAHISLRRIEFSRAPEIVKTVALRFCSNRSVTEMLASCAAAHPPYEVLVREAQTMVLGHAESAITLSMAGNPASAIDNLLQQGRETLNVRLIDNAYQLLQKHAGKVSDSDGLKTRILELRQRAGAGNRKITLGHSRRQAGGMVMRSGGRPPVKQAAN